MGRRMSKNILLVASYTILLAGCEVDINTEEDELGNDINDQTQTDDEEPEPAPTPADFEPDIGDDGEDSERDVSEDNRTACDYGSSAIQTTLNLPDTSYNYAQQPIPDYITKDNTQNNPITDHGATLGRVLFYDKKLSSDNSIACASCHQQEVAFSDRDQQSVGISGLTGRHSMRLVNARFGDETQFFWDERAQTLEAQTTQPIQDPIEMGYSGEEGDPGFAELIDKLEDVDYYSELFTCAFGDSEITEQRIQLALAQFVRSIQSFDSKYDAGRAQVRGDNVDFPNFSDEENQGKELFLGRPNFDAQGQRIGGGLGCQGCHRAPEFDIDPDSGNNGQVLEIDGNISLDITRAPTLRDMFDPNGFLNGDLMHSGNPGGINDALDHYNDGIGSSGVVPDGLDRRLRAPGGGGPGTVQPTRLNLTSQERAAVITFLLTLSGQDVYTNVKWSDPFR